LVCLPLLTGGAVPDYRETTINIVHDTKQAYVWSNNRRIVNKLKRMGAKVEGKPGPGAWFVVGERQISFRKLRFKHGSGATKGNPDRGQG